VKPKKPGPNHCRLAVILARDASKAVIFRRGPSVWTQVILWDTYTDTFEEGQWFKGRIYTERCDLSPDGSKLVYFAAKHHAVRDSAFTAWTAVSRPPYVTALMLWSNAGTYGGGGYFENDQTIWLNIWERSPDVVNMPMPAGFTVRYPDRQRRIVGNHQYTAHGWSVVEDANPYLYAKRVPYDPEWFKYTRWYDTPITWRKDHPEGIYSLTSTELGYSGNRYGSIYARDVTLLRDDVEIELLTDEWADWDQQGRLVYVSEGKLYIGHLQGGKVIPDLLHDFNPNKVQMIQSPGWAKTWNQTP
jgi:hypothetical protein